MSNTKLIAAIIFFVENDSQGSSFFQHTDNDKNTVSFKTDDNGDCCAEEHGQEDIEEARKLAYEIIEEFGRENFTKFDIEPVDEFVTLEVRLK